MSVRLRRSVLYVPGDKPRVLEKAPTLPADCIIVDLEDAVAPNAKGAARDAAAAMLGSRAFAARETVLRINGAGTPEHDADLAAAVAARPDAILLPKVETIDDVERVDTALANLGAPPEIALWLMIETPRAVLEIGALALGTAAVSKRVAVLVLGLNDLAKAMGIALDRAVVQTVLFNTALAARASGLAILDGVHNNITDKAAFEAECRQARALGFDGKTLIHPSQIEAANACFVPDAADVAEAKAIVTAFALAEHRNAGVISLDGRMVERLHLAAAEAVLARARLAKA